MNEHYIVTVDRGQLRIYVESALAGQRNPRLEVVETLDFPGRGRLSPLASIRSESAHAFVGEVTRNGSDRVPP